MRIGISQGEKRMKGNESFEKIKCKICGHEWKVRIKKPKCCPKCKRYDYDKVQEKKQ